MDRSPMQGIAPRGIIGIIASEVNSDSEQARGPNPRDLQATNKLTNQLGD
jgi:hypothetical protein